MDPDFQRDAGIWDEEKKSKLIESVLMRIPLPVFYLAEDPHGQTVVVDGLQRLSTFQSFADDKLRLRLPARPELNRKLFRDLPPKLQNRFEDAVLTLYLVDEKAPYQARLDIFERVNSGVALSRQQMRNCLFTGPATRFLKDEANTGLFLEATGGSLNTRTMRDREFVNRFCAFQSIGIDAYAGDMDSFLAEALTEMNTNTDILEDLSVKFRTSMTNNLNVFGRHAFRKHSPGQEHRRMINAALWDVMSIGLAWYPPHIVEKQSESLRLAFYDLMEDAEFDAAITLSTNTVKNVINRFNAATEMFMDVFGAHCGEGYAPRSWARPKKR